MTHRFSPLLLILILGVANLAASDRDEVNLQPAPLNDDPLVFGDAVGPA